ncbi:MAG: FAD-dependent oxidoreductase [Planctomycetota bacterium]|nr:FAD-dependent oxidoreductase [Planctomycetota bacterium]
MRIRYRAGWFLVLFMTATAFAQQPPITKVDVCVYGGTASGVAAAVAVVHEGKSVILIEPGRHLGGMTTGGLGYTDFGNKAVIGGISRTFYKELGKVYRKDEVWTFEPHVAENVFKQWVQENNIKVLFEHRLQSLRKTGPRIVALTLEKAGVDDTGAPLPQPTRRDAAFIEAAMYIDATYEGDLMAAANVTYTVGREAVEQYGESLNGIRAKTPAHQFLLKVDPYLKPADPSSGLLPFIATGDGGKPGGADNSVQAYNFRLCLTQNPANRLPIAPPPAYDQKRYELLARYLEALDAADKKPNLGMLLKIDMMPNGKTDINNNGAVSTDFIGQNYPYPDGDWPTRSRIWKNHQHYIRGLLHFLATSPRVPDNIRQDMSHWTLCRDEFTDTAGWPHQMYVREARRMVGRYVITQADCEHKRTCDDSIGMAAYNMDSHNCQRIVKNNTVENEGDVQVRPTGPYPVSYRAITPNEDQCDNLLVPVCLSATHIAYGSVRMEPVFMALGESAARAACAAIAQKTSVQRIDIPTLTTKLQAAGQVLKYAPR